ncbi:hypothetical protein JXA31_01760 [Candidatus Bathyarchaeota archaeon]|nr:hypothetical protein [Candidatus Bathyarchaeota archaeon]
MCIRDRKQTSLSDWVFAFLQGFRFEYSKISEQEKRFLEPFLKEQTLTRHCQVEIVQFTNPDRIVLLFFFDSTKKDLLIDIHKSNWSNLDLTVEMLIAKYPTLKIQRADLWELISRCKDIKPSAIYSIHFVDNICCISFARDPRKKGSLFPWSFNYINDPQQLAEVIFNLNLNQASTYF